MTITIKPSEAQPGDLIQSVPAPDPKIREVEAWESDGFVKITFEDGRVFNTRDSRPITIKRGAA